MLLAMVGAGQYAAGVLRTAYYLGTTLRVHPGGVSLVAIRSTQSAVRCGLTEHHCVLDRCNATAHGRPVLLAMVGAGRYAAGVLRTAYYLGTT